MSEKKPHLLFVINDAAYVVSHRIALIKEAIDKGWSVSVLAPDIESYKPFTSLNLPIFYKNLSIKRKGLNPLKEIKGLLDLYRYIKETNPDIIHGVTLKPAFYAGLVGRLLKKPKQIHMFNGLGFLFTNQNRSTKLIRTVLWPLFKIAFAKKRSIALFQNQDDLKKLVSLGLIKQKQTEIIRGSGVDLDEFKYTPEPNYETPLVLLPARLIKAKGIDEYVLAARALKLKHVKARFCIAGPIDDQNPTGYREADIKEWVKKGWIEYLGYCKDMAKIYRQSNIVCLPSYYGEGLPKCLLEAAATGRSIVTTDHTGCREAVDNQTNGFLVPIKDADALASALEKLINAPMLRQEFGLNSRKKAEDEFSKEIVVEQTFDLYNRLLNKR